MASERSRQYYFVRLLAFLTAPGSYTETAIIKKDKLFPEMGRECPTPWIDCSHDYKKAIHHHPVI